MNIKNDYKVSFGKAQLNVAATSDNHGKFEPIANLYSNLVHNKRDVFEKSGFRGVKNAIFFCGDWFMEPSKKGFFCDKNITNGVFQLLFFNELMTNLRESIDKKMLAFYTPGNHDLDSGDKSWFHYASRMLAKIVLTNFSLKDSKKVIESVHAQFQDNISQKEIIEIPDDKNPDLVNKVLVLGATIPGMGFYNPGVVNDLKIYDDGDKKDAKIKEEDLEKTYESIRKEVEAFKRENPKGVVILMSHTGLKISEFIAKNVPDIDIILNGHDHKDDESIYDNTRIIRLGDDSKFFKTFKIKFDDYGNYIKDDSPVIKYDSKEAAPLYDNLFEEMAKKLFEEDNKPYFTINGPENVELSQKNIRMDQNNKLAKFITGTILKGIRKIDPEVQIFGVSSSAIRGDLPINSPITNIRFRDLLSGQTEPLSKLYTIKFDGQKIAQSVLEYTQDQTFSKQPERESIIIWGGLDIELDKIREFEKEKGKGNVKAEEILPFINFVDQDGIKKPLDPDKQYKIAFPSAFFLRPKMTPFVNAKDEVKLLTSNAYIQDSFTMEDILRICINENEMSVKS